MLPSLTPSRLRLPQEAADTDAGEVPGWMPIIDASEIMHNERVSRAMRITSRAMEPGHEDTQAAEDHNGKDH